MIPIKYNTSNLPKYDALLSDVKDVIERCLYNRKRDAQNNKYYYCLYKKAKIYEDGVCDVFLKYLSDNNAQKLTEIANKPAEELEDVINDFCTQFQELSIPINKKSAIYKLACYIFIENGYKKLNNNELIDAVGIDVCPYCNRIYVKHIAGKNGKHVKGELDHFYEKSLYPYLAISKYNLVPSCSYCNGHAGKKVADMHNTNEKIDNPYLLDNSDGITFYADFVGTNILSLSKCASDIKIKVLGNTADRKRQIRLFNLTEIYNTHVDYAADLYVKKHLMKNKWYRDFVTRFLSSSGITTNRDDLYRLLYGIYTNEKDFGKRPLSKFQHDIAKQYKLV